MVTGASGHLGNVLARHLLAQGRRDVRALVRGGEGSPALAGLGVELVRGDLLEPASLQAAFEGAHEVVHLASLVSIGAADERQVQRVNVEGTGNVLQAARAAGVRRVLYVGTAHAYAPHPDGRIDETCGFVGPGATVYERSKASATRLALAAATDLDVLVVAPGGVLGPFDYRRSEVGALIRGWTRRPIALTAPGGYDFTDVRDVADALQRALTVGRRGRTYLLGGRYVGITEMARTVMAHLGRGRVVQVPLPVARAGARVALAVARATGTTAVLTPYALATMTCRVRLDWSRAARELGATCRPTARSLADTADWWVAHPALGGSGRSSAGRAGDGIPARDNLS